MKAPSQPEVKLSKQREENQQLPAAICKTGSSNCTLAHVAIHFIKPRPFSSKPQRMSSGRSHPCWALHQTFVLQPLPSNRRPHPFAGVCKSCPRSRNPSKSAPWMSRDGCDVVSGQFAVGVACAHLTMSQLDLILYPSSQHQQQDLPCFGQPSNEFLHGEWLPKGCHHLETTDHQ